MVQRITMNRKISSNEKKKFLDVEVSGKIRLFGSAVANVRKGSTKGKTFSGGTGWMHSDQLCKVNHGVTRTLTDLRNGAPARLVHTRGGKDRSVILSRMKPPVHWISSNGHGGLLASQGREAWEDHPKPNHVNAPDYPTQWPHDLFHEPLASCAGSAVFIRNLPPTITEDQLRQLFQRVGKVVSVKLDRGPLPTAKVGFLKRFSACDAVAFFMGYRWHGKTLKVCVLEPSSPQESSKSDDEQFSLVSESRRFGEPWNPYGVRRVVRQTENSALQSDAPPISVFDRLN